MWCEWWISDSSTVDVVILWWVFYFKKMWFWKRIWLKMPTTFWLYHRSFMIGWVYWSTLGTCEPAAFLAWLAALAFPIIHVKRWEHAQTHLSIRWFWSFVFGPIHGLQCFTSQGQIFNYDPDLHFFCLRCILYLCIPPCHLHVCIPAHKFQVHY